MKLLALALLPVAVAATQSRAAARMSANPIRKVVNMLQAMQKKVEEEGEKADQLYKTFMCYCKTNQGALEEAIAAGEEKVPELTASIAADEGKLAQLKKDVESHQADREAAKSAMAEAQALREKEKAAFDKALAESQTNIAALDKAIAALSKGMLGSFLQTGTAARLAVVVKANRNLLDADRETVLSFLAGTYAPASGEIVGILKELRDEMLADQNELVATEEAAVKDYEGLMESKKKEVAALTSSIEEKLSRTAEVSVNIAAMKNDLEDTAEVLQQDKAFARDLKSNCESKEAVHEEEKKVRAEEVVAIADTIKILNDDEALDLFKKTLPSPGQSFMQLQVTSASMRAEARQILAQARARAPAGNRHHLDFIALALQGRKAGFEHVLELVDKLVATLKLEQSEDDDKKQYCSKELDEAEDKLKEGQRQISDLGAVIAESKEAVDALTAEIKSLEEGIVGLDKAVADATEQRKAENAEYKELMASDTAAKEVILFAKNRLQKFYNPKLHKAPPKQELSAEDRIVSNMGGQVDGQAPAGAAEAFIQLRSHVRGRAAPPPPPETAAAYMKKSEESGGVMAMMDLLVSDLDKQMTVADAEETNAQKQYEQLMHESADKRAEDSKALTDKEGAVADLKTGLEESAADKKSAEKELQAMETSLASLHTECDWLMQYYDVRKEARADEIDSLDKAKAVLSGADYSLLQRGERHVVRVHRFRPRRA